MRIGSALHHGPLIWMLAEDHNLSQMGNFHVPRYVSRFKPPDDSRQSAGKSMSSVMYLTLLLLQQRQQQERSMTDLRQIRRTHGLSMTELALKADVAPSTLSLVERGKRPSRHTAERIASALGLPPVRLWENFDALRRY